MERYFEIRYLSDAGSNEEITAVYPDSSKNVNGRKGDGKIIKAARDADNGLCRLLVWRRTDLDTGYLLTLNDVEQLQARYNNARIAMETGSAKDCIYEKGKAEALAGVLRMIGKDPAERRLLKFETD